MIKYLGSKRRLVPVLGELCTASGARTALDLFTGTTRVAQEFKRRGAHVTAVDTARYSEVFADCYVATDAARVDLTGLRAEIARLDALPGTPGYVTQTFCVESRFFRPENGERIDAIREHLAAEHAGSPWFAILLTSLIEAADRVDSTTGVQMAYLKQWAPRADNRLTLRVPELVAGSGRSVRADAAEVAGTLGGFDLAYLDPPYNQHRYVGNYHIWETLVAWDRPDHYGVACKRVDTRDDATRSGFNRKREMPGLLRRVIADVDARVVVVSYNDEAWVSVDELVEMCAPRGHVAVLGFDSKRYVGAQIGVFNPRGEKVGTASRLRNVEYLVVAGPEGDVERMKAAIGSSADSLG